MMLQKEGGHVEHSSNRGAKKCIFSPGIVNSPKYLDKTVTST